MLMNYEMSLIPERLGCVCRYLSLIMMHSQTKRANNCRSLVIIGFPLMTSNTQWNVEALSEDDGRSLFERNFWWKFFSRRHSRTARLISAYFSSNFYLPGNYTKTIHTDTIITEYLFLFGSINNKRIFKGIRLLIYDVGRSGYTM